MKRSPDVPVGARRRSRAPDPFQANQRTGLVSLLLAGLACLVYLNTFDNQFVFDDRLHIRDNPSSHDLSDLATILTTNHFGGTGGGGYRPLVVWSYALNYEVGGLDPFGYHLVNLLIHAVNTVLVYLVTQRLFGRHAASLAVGVLFAVHPVNTESVAWISGRADLFAAMFVLIAWWGYLRASSPRDFDLRWYGLSLIAFTCALLSKEHALMFPAVLLFTDVWRSRLSDTGIWNRVKAVGSKVLRYYPLYFVLIAGYLFARNQIFGSSLLYDPSGIPFVDNPLASVPLYPRLLTALTVLADYVKLVVWPVTLSADYSFNQIPVAHSLLEPEVLTACLVLTTLVILAGLAFWRSRPEWLGITLFFTVLAPVSNIPTVIGTIMAERFLYLSSIGMWMVAGLLLDQGLQWARQRPNGRRLLRVSGVFLVIIVCFLASRTVVRNQAWTHEYALWQSTVEAAPFSAKAHNNLGSLALEKGRLREAREAFERAIAIYPEYGAAYLNLGSTSLKLGRLEEAVWAYRKAAGLLPDMAQAHYNLGLALLKQGKLDQAVSAYERARALDPEDPNTLNSLGYAYAQQGKEEAAKEAYDQALALRPDFPEALYNKGRWLEAHGRFREAVGAYEQALAHGGRTAGLHQRIGRLYLHQLDDPQQAKAHWCQALALASSPEAIIALRSDIEDLTEYTDQARSASSEPICVSYEK